MKAIKILFIFCLFGLYDLSQAQKGSSMGNSRQRNVQLSLRVISYQDALGLWEARDSSRFLLDKEINKIAFRAYTDARKRGLSSAGDLGRLIGALIRSYQGHDRDSWRERIGQFFELTANKAAVPRGFEEAMLNIIIAIGFGDRESIASTVIDLVYTLL
jgi:hypothetical protein